MKLKTLLFVLLLAAGFGANAQVIVASQVQIGNKRINSISDDSALANQSHISIPTEYAVVNYFTNHISNLKITTGHTYVKDNVDSMLAIVDSIGTMCVRSDSSVTFVLTAQPATDYNNWVQLQFPAAVPTVFGRTGPITAQESDYNAYYPMLSGSYSNPAWLNSLAWSKLTGLPTTRDGYGLTDVYTKTEVDNVKAHYVASISALENVVTNSTTVIVQDSLRGGTFSYVASATPDSGTVFPRYGGGYWKRDFSQSNGIFLKWFGAKGDGITNDSMAVKNWFHAGITSSINKMKASAGSYNITGCGDCFLTTGGGIATNGINIEGAGQDVTIFKTNGGFSGKSIFTLDGVKRVTISGFTVFNTDTTGVAFKLGTKTDFKISAIRDIYIYGFDTAVYLGAGYENRLNNLNIIGNHNGIIVNGNGIVVANTNIESANIGIDVAKDYPLYDNGTISLTNNVIQSSKTAIKIRKARNITINSCYFEGNTAGDILAGTDSGDNIGYLSINSPYGSNSSGDSILIDRVGYLSYKDAAVGVSNNYKNIKITNNCQFVDLSPLLYNYDYSLASVEPYISDYNKNRQTSFPFWFYDFRDVNIVGTTSAQTNIDKNGHVYFNESNGTIKDTSDSQTGDNAILFRANSGMTSARLFVKFDSAAIPLYADYLNFTYTMKLGSIDSTFQKVVVVDYYDTLGALHVITYVNSNPSFDSYKNIIGNWVTTTLPINLKAFKAAYPDFSSFYYIYISWNIYSGASSKGTETITLDNVGLYTSKYPNTFLTDNMFSYQSKYANNLKYLQVDNGATLPTATSIGATTSTELGYIHGLSSAVQTQLNAKVATSVTVNGHPLSTNVTVTYPDIPAGAIANGTTATTQAPADSSGKLETTAGAKQLLAALNAQIYAESGVAIDTIKHPGHLTFVIDPVYLDSAINGTGTPTVAVGTNFTGTATIDANSTDKHGSVTFNTTSSTSYATNSHIVDITFATSYATAPTVVITPASAQAATFSTAATASIYVTNVTTTGFSIAIATSGTSSVVSGYKWNYKVN